MVSDLLARTNVKTAGLSFTDILAKVCAGKDADTQVLLHLADDLDGMIDGKV